MISRFINLFKKNDLDEQRAFQNKVLSMLTDIYPEREFSADPDPLVIVSGENKLGLTNLRSYYLLEGQDDVELIDRIKTHIGAVIQKSELPEEDLNFESLRQKIMPQLMPVDFLTRMSLVNFPFGDDVVLGFVLDGDEAYRYIRDEDLNAWTIDKEELKEIALFNLSERSRGIEMQVLNDDSIFVINTMDGFDAVRITMPKLRELVAENIGSPFCFGIPNRDFLICWSYEAAGGKFHNDMVTQVASDRDERPYPLSGSAFLVNEQNEIVLMTSDVRDERASNAELN